MRIDKDVVNQRVAKRRRIAEVQRERYEKLENELVERTVAHLEVDLRSPQLVGPLHPILATAATIAAPLIGVAVAVGLGGSGWLLLGAAAATLLFASVLGSLVWRRTQQSQGLPYGQLMLWNWMRQRRAEAQLVASARQLGLDRWGTFVSQTSATRDEQIALLYRLNAALEMKDPYTLGHSRRVARHSYRIALAMGLRSDAIETLRRTASLHDIGKLAVPDHVLRKPGKLSEEEWELMNTHSAAGARILSILGMPAIDAAVRSHHERWDGAGYPDGLAGGAIPLAARIIAVADTYDAITTARPYRDRAGRARAVKVLRAERGHQFDPAVVDAFLRTQDRPALLLFFSFLLNAPRWMGERVLSWIRHLASEFPGATAVLTGTAMLVAVGLPATIDSPERPSQDRKQTVAVPAPVAPDEVLGTQIGREVKKPAGKKPSKQNRGRGADGAAAGRSETNGAATGTSQAVEPKRAVVAGGRERADRNAPVNDPNATEDPEPASGLDCSHPGVVSRGSGFHCDAELDGDDEPDRDDQSSRNDRSDSDDD